MKKFFLRYKLHYALLFFLSILALTACAKNKGTEKATTKTEQTTPDSKEKKTAEQKSPDTKKDKRIVAGTVAIANLLDRLDYSNVVGVPKTEHQLADRYKKATVIGQPMSPNLEIIKSLRPDLVFSEKSLAETNEKKMKNFKIPVQFIDLSTYDAIVQSIQQVAKEIDREKQGAQQIKEIEKDANSALALSKGKKSPKVLFLFGTPKSTMVGTETSYMGSLMKKLNITNIAKGKQPYFPLSMEKIVSENPDIILVMTHVNPNQAQKMMQSQFEKDPLWKNTTAYKTKKIIYLDNDLYSVTGNVRVGEALKKLAEMVYGK